jgi:GTP-binding protein
LFWRFDGWNFRRFPVFVDQAEIYVKGGDGGPGCLSFRREKFVPRGGPDGGDGGDGGSVVFEASDDADTLMPFLGHHHWFAKNGLPGEGKDKSGRKGEDLVLKMPVGTLVFDRDSGLLIKDLSTPGERVIIAQGGPGGRGNARFARPTHQTPREFEEGTPGEERWLRLELKLIADVGLVGLPNAGKSTLLARLSRAHPKIADYPFTTLKPQLGIVELSGGRRFVMADIPGLIEGAHEGAGLGDEFLRHIERTRTILHLVDVGSPYQEQTPIEAYHLIRQELGKYSSLLAEKPELIVATKLDLTDAEANATELSETLGREVIGISGATGRGLPALVERIWKMLQDMEAPGLSDAPAPTMPLPAPPHRTNA